MKCKKCNGKGTYKVRKRDEVISCLMYMEDVKCDKCNGTGEGEQTNEEWFCELSTEEKAKRLENKMTWAAQEQGTFTAKGWEIWLKQPHTRSDKNAK